MKKEEEEEGEGTKGKEREEERRANPELGSFAILDVRHPDNAQPGTVLAIRRNGGILGRLQINDVSIEGTIASPTTLFNETQPEAGDELILDEVVKLAN